MTAESRRHLAESRRHLHVEASANGEYSLMIEVGRRSDGRKTRGFDFGDTASVYVSQAYARGGKFEVGVSQGSIGSHDTERARWRIAAYDAAATIADLVESAIRDGSTLADVAARFDGMVWYI